SDQDISKLSRLQAFGFAHSRTFHRMTMDFGDVIEPVALPDGINLQAFIRGDDDEALVDAYRDAFRDHYGHLDQPFETDLAIWQRWMDDDDFDSSLWFLATDAASGTVAGYCCCYAEDHGDDTVGLIDELGVRRDWRRRGIARALLTHALSVLQGGGLHGANLRVDSDNKKGALRLYESVGMDVISSTHTYVKELRPGVNLVTQ
ncbi:GNAT family N-acetyltransferase, partial [Candidatus Bipolaricaulota bacterium]|nr:GNAT family N-acetyltransferase [Candidatus Bipolaricaulota bacterium]